jgi:Trm5-related predicted tRNA methylase
MWQDAETVAREGIAAVMRNDTVYVPGRVNRVFASVARVLTPGQARAVMRSQAKRYRAVQSPR